MITRSAFAAAALLALCGLCTSSPVLAQCSTGAENFATVGGQGTQKIRIGIAGPGVSGPGAQGAGNEIGRFWQSTDSTQGNNFEGLCPSNDPTQTFGAWWQNANTGGAACDNSNGVGAVCRGIRGAIAGVGCDANTCPAGPLTVVIEDWDIGGPPGVGGTAYFIALQTAKDSPDAGSGRRWDHALVDDPVAPGVNNTGLQMQELPKCTVVASSKTVDGVNVDQDISDAGVGSWSVDINVNALPDSSVIAGYNVCTASGAGDPGRDRALWNCGATLPYSEGTSVLASVPVECGAGVVDSWIAVGLTFEGGLDPASDVPSALVGSACQIECNPNTADPQPINRPQFSPDRKLRPTRRGR